VSTSSAETCSTPSPGGLDLVVANLPYLPEGLRGARGYEDLDREPPAAVFGPGDGLDPYRRLLAAAQAQLSPDGAAIIQLRRKMFEAAREELSDLRSRLGELARAAA
jgi:methylase of polypeptide subunit release factors